MHVMPIQKINYNISGLQSQTLLIDFQSSSHLQTNSLEDRQLRDDISSSSFWDAFCFIRLKYRKDVEQKMKITGTTVKQLTGQKRPKFWPAASRPLCYCTQQSNPTQLDLSATSFRAENKDKK